MNKEGLQKLIDNFDIDKYLSSDGYLIPRLLLDFQKQDYKSVLKELKVPDWDNRKKDDKLYYNTYIDIIEIYYNNPVSLDERLIYNKDDLNGIINGVNFLRKKHELA